MLSLSFLFEISVDFLKSTEENKLNTYLRSNNDKQLLNDYQRANILRFKKDPQSLPPKNSMMYNFIKNKHNKELDVRFHQLSQQRGMSI
jgi:hypothetical protein